MEFLRHQPDLFAGLAVILDDVEAVDADRPGARIDDAADDADKRRLAGAIGTEQCEYLAPLDIERDVFQGLEARRIGFVEMGNGDHGLHARGYVIAHATLG